MSEPNLPLFSFSFRFYHLEILGKENLEKMLVFFSVDCVQICYLINGIRTRDATYFQLVLIHVKVKPPKRVKLPNEEG